MVAPRHIHAPPPDLWNASPPTISALIESLTATDDCRSSRALSFLECFDRFHVPSDRGDLAADQSTTLWTREGTRRDQASTVALGAEIMKVPQSSESGPEP